MTSTALQREQLLAPHLEELQKSAISEPIIRANFESTGGTDVLEWLIEHKFDSMGAHASQYATTEVRNLKERLEPMTDGGGWRGCGLDPLNNWEAMEWGCFKPDSPRPAWKKRSDGEWVKTEDTVKYEHPQGIAARAFFPDLDPENPHIGRNYWRSVVCATKKPLIITEGMKKACCLMSAGFAAIGLPGVSMWNQPKTRNLIPELECFAAEGRPIYICFDQDTKVSTRRNVRAEIFKLSAALRRHQCKVHVIEWAPDFGKGVDDFIALSGVDAFTHAYDQAVTYEVFSVRAQSELLLTPDWECPDHIQYLTDGGLLDALPPAAKLIGLKAPKGTGKTFAAKQIAHQAMERGQRVLLLSHRVQLANALAERISVMSIYEVNESRGEERDLAWVDVQANGMALCIHSCHPDSQARFHGEDWTDALIIIDEATQVWWELLNSRTIKKQRVPILRELRTLLTGALSPESQGRVLLMDADLDRTILDAVRGIGNQPDLKPWVGVSHSKENTYQAVHYDRPEGWLIETENTLALGNKILVMTDSQKKKGRFSSVALEQRWIKKFPALRILRVDSESLSLVGHPAFGCIDKTNEVFAQYDVVICSPSVETGISLDITGHFTAVHGCFQGVLSENSVRQSLARLRAPVPRHIYIAPCGLDQIGGGETWWKALQDNQDQKVKEALARIFHAGRDDLNTNFLRSQVEAWAKYAARNNAGRACYRQVVLARLRDEGHQVNELDSREIADIDSLKAIRQETSGERYQRLINHGEAVITAADISDEDYQKRTDARSIPSLEQARELERKALAQTYGVTPTLGLYMLNEYDWFNKIRNHYFLTVGREHLTAREMARIEELLAHAGNEHDLWTPDVARSSLSLRIACLEWLEIPTVLEFAKLEVITDVLTQCISVESELTQRIAEKARTNWKAVKLALGITINKNHADTIIVRNILKTVGFGFAKAFRPRSPITGEQGRYYPVIQLDEIVFTNGPTNIVFDYSRDAIFEAWLNRTVDSGVKSKSREANGSELRRDTDGNNIDPIPTPGDSALTPAVDTQNAPVVEPIETDIQTAPIPAPVVAPSEAVEPVALYPVPDYVVPTPDLGWEESMFESGLINAQTMRELRLVKKSTPFAVRSRVMKRWQKDKRYQWLEEKAAYLMLRDEKCVERNGVTYLNPGD